MDDLDLNDGNTPRSGPGIRDARPAEAGLLTELAVRSKAHWGYSAAFMERCRPLLTVTEEYVRTTPVRVVAVGTTPVGFHSLKRLDADRVELDLLFVEPAWIGRGVGARLYADALRAAADMGATVLVIESEPFAEAFYLRRGAVRVGTVPSTIEEGRRLPLLEARLTAC